MDIDDRLRRLRKEREGRSRAQKIRDTWQNLDRSEELSVKQKLERLIQLSGNRKPDAPPRPVEGEVRAPNPKDSVLYLENAYQLSARYGKIPISLGPDIPGEILSCLGRDAAFKDMSLSSAVFLDLETTGLAGGTGTVPFLAGLGFYADGRFKVGQYFLGDLAEEGRMIREMGRFFRDMNFTSVVTYNGKAFDIPLLETRFALNREPFPLDELPHLDFIFSARNLWKHKYESCRLFHLAREIVEAERSEDIPSAEIPLRYFQYLRTGDFSLIEPIIYHNQEDILSLLGVVIAGGVLLDRNRQSAGETGVDAMDLYGVGRLLEGAGDYEKSVSLFEKALEGNVSREVSLTIRKKLSSHFKKSRDWSKAVSLWQGMSQTNEVFSYRELAMYYEHREKNYDEAIRVAEEGLALSMEVSSPFEKDFARRIERLKQKAKKAKDGARS